MGLAVLADAVRERFHAPVLGLIDLAAHPFDGRFVLIGEFFHLLRAKILARKKNVLVKGHAVPFPVSNLTPAPSPSSLRKGSMLRRRKLRDARPKALPPEAAVRSVPNRDRAKCALIRDRAEKTRL
jgi:hypothetical protein